MQSSCKRRIHIDSYMWTVGKWLCKLFFFKSKGTLEVGGKVGGLSSVQFEKKIGEHSLYIILLRC